MFKKSFSRKSSRGSFDDIPLPTPQTSSTNLIAVAAQPIPPTPQVAPVPIETRLQQKTDLLDELRKTLPLDVRVPTIITVGAKGSGKSSVLETLTGVGFPRGPNGSTRRAVKCMITADPTANSEFALVSEKDASCREGAKRVHLEELGNTLAQLFAPKPAPARHSYEEDDESTTSAPVEALEGPIYVRVVRPAGPSYQVVDLPGLTDENTDEIEALLSEDPKCLILPVLTVHEVFDHSEAVKLAKKVDPDGRRIIGVVTKIDQVEKDHHIVEKLQMTSRRDVSLPLGYVAVRLLSTEEAAAGTMTRAQLLDIETQFFATNPLLKGLRPERWGAVTLKKLVVEYQSNFISHRIPDLSKQVRHEIEIVENEIRETNSTFAHPQHFFTKVVSDVGSMAFEFQDLVTGARTRDDQSVNLGARFYQAVSGREAEARKKLPSCMSPAFAEYIKRELAQVPGMVSGNDALSHPVFTKAIREHCGPVLKEYASSLVHDANGQLRDVVNALVDERFSEFPRLVEALRTDFEVLANAKVAQAESVIQRLLEAELSWIFVSDGDQASMVKDVQQIINKKSTLKPSADLWSEDGEEDPSVIRPLVLRSDSERDIENFQATLDVFIRFFTRRIFYTVPMNIRNIMLTEFRKDMVEVVVSKYNDDNKLRTLMSVELWLDQLQSQRSEKKHALIEVLSKLDLLV